MQNIHNLHKSCNTHAQTYVECIAVYIRPTNIYMNQHKTTTTLDACLFMFSYVLCMFFLANIFSSVLFRTCLIAFQWTGSFTLTFYIDDVRLYIYIYISEWGRPNGLFHSWARWGGGGGGDGEYSVCVCVCVFVRRVGRRRAGRDPPTKETLRFCLLGWVAAGPRNYSPL